MVFPRYTPTSGIAISSVALIFRFLRKLHTLLSVGSAPAPVFSFLPEGQPTLPAEVPACLSQLAPTHQYSHLCCHRKKEHLVGLISIIPKRTYSAHFIKYGSCPQGAGHIVTASPSSWKGTSPSQEETSRGDPTGYETASSRGALPTLKVLLPRSPGLEWNMRRCPARRHGESGLLVFFKFW